MVIKNLKMKFYFIEIKLKKMLSGSQINNPEYDKVVLRKNPQKTKQERVKLSTHNNKVQKIEQNAEEGDFRVKRIGYNFRQTLQQARVSMKLSQKELAQRLNVKPSVINEYESGKAIPNPQLINKMNRILKVKLPRN